ncbi:hypothetical protein DRN67_04425 [Candidatus Micrarchaeota archaeon]|nr:MAG: hypothetical protein DRN67_04425 [Candidatus Micrarchaeota archaeon]
MRVWEISVALLLFSLLLFGCPQLDELMGGGQPTYGFNDAMTALQLVEENFKKAETTSELEQYAAEVEAVKNEQGARLTGEEKAAFEAFADYRLKEIDARKEVYDASDVAKPESEDAEGLERAAGRASEAADAVDDALDALSAFKSDYPQYAQGIDTCEE